MAAAAIEASPPDPPDPPDPPTPSLAAFLFPPCSSLVSLQPPSSFVSSPQPRPSYTFPPQPPFSHAAVFQLQTVHVAFLQLIENICFLISIYLDLHLRTRFHISLERFSGFTSHIANFSFMEWLLLSSSSFMEFYLVSASFMQGDVSMAFNISFVYAHKRCNLFETSNHILIISSTSMVIVIAISDPDSKFEDPDLRIENLVLCVLSIVATVRSLTAVCRALSVFVPSVGCHSLPHGFDLWFYRFNADLVQIFSAIFSPLKEFEKVSQVCSLGFS